MGVAPTATIDTLPLAEGPGLAHDAGNLLGALGLYCDLLQAPGVLRPEHRHYASELRHLSQRSGAMIRRLLTQFAPADTASTLPALSGAAMPESAQPGPVAPGRTEAAAACSDPAAVLREQAPLLERIAAPWARVIVETGPALPGLDFPVEFLERIVFNLVLNAAEAIRGRRDAQPAAGRIHVSLAVVDGAMRLTVADNGPGLPPAIAAAFLLPTPLPVGAARGLGHRIVHELAHASGGRLAIRVLPGKGSAFSLEWPLAGLTAAAKQPLQGGVTAC